MNKTIMLIIFIIIVVLFCLAGYLYVNKSNKQIIERFYQGNGEGGGEGDGDGERQVSQEGQIIRGITTHYLVNLFIEDINQTTESQSESTIEKIITPQINQIDEPTPLCGNFLNCDYICSSMSECTLSTPVPLIVGKTESATNITENFESNTLHEYTITHELSSEHTLYGFNQNDKTQHLKHIHIFYENLDNSKFLSLTHIPTDDSTITLKITFNESPIINSDGDIQIHFVYLINNEGNTNSDSSSSTTQANQNNQNNQNCDNVTLNQDSNLSNVCEENCEPVLSNESYLHTKCFGSDEYSENTCNYNNQEGSNLSGDLMNCSHDSNCRMFYNNSTDFNRFFCRSQGENTGLENAYPLNYVNIPQHHFENSEALEIFSNEDSDSFVRDELIHYIEENSSDNNTLQISLQQLESNENIFITASNVFIEDESIQTEIDFSNFKSSIVLTLANDESISLAYTAD